MMDCGCGSYEQMVRFFHDKVETELAKIKMIFISHIHLDHTLVSDLLIINMQMNVYISGLVFTSTDPASKRNFKIYITKRYKH